jgi:ureidoglycolate lyase
MEAIVRTFTARPLTSDAFAPFGEVLSFDERGARLVNDGRAVRANTQARFEYAPGIDAPVMAIYRATGDALPFRVTTLERHPHSSQTFLSLSAHRFLVVVAPRQDGGGPDTTQIQAFVGRAGQGINYARNVWHAPITAIGSGGDFLMFMWERGSEDDCVFHHPAYPLHIHDFQ